MKKRRGTHTKPRRRPTGKPDSRNLSPPVATFWPAGGSVDVYWRCEVPARHLPGRIPNLAGMTLDAVADVQAGAAVFQAAGSPDAMVLTRAFGDVGVPVLVDVDNNGYADDWPFVDMTSQLRVHRQIVPLADAVIVATDALAEVYAEHNPNVHVCPNSVDPDDFPTLRKPDDEVFRIGFAGTDGHRLNAPLLERAVRWASRQPDVEVVVFGVEAEWAGVEVTRRKWTPNLRVFRKALQRVDVLLCPLIDSDFMRCKTDVKGLEAAMAGALPIMSDSEPYRGWSRHGVLVKGADGFEEAVRWAVGNRDEVRRRALAAREHVLAARTISENVGRWQTALQAAGFLFMPPITKEM